MRRSIGCSRWATWSTEDRSRIRSWSGSTSRGFMRSAATMTSWSGAQRLGIPYLEVDRLIYGGAWLDKISVSKRGQLGRRLRALPLTLEVETLSGLVGLVHADCPFDDWHEMQQVPWASVEPTGKLAECYLWSTERFERQYPNAIRNVRAVVHGHMTVRYSKVLGNVHFLDTGGWKEGGCFSFLELGSLKVFTGPIQPKPSLRNRLDGKDWGCTPAPGSFAPPCGLPLNLVLSRWFG